MKFDKYVSNTSNTFARNKLLTFLVIILAGVVVFSQIKIASLALNEKVVLVPVGLSEKAKIGSSVADETYLTAMGVYGSTLLYSTTAATVETQYALFCKLLSSEAYAKYSSSLLETASTQAKNMVSLNSKIEKITVTLAPEQVIRISVNVDKYIFGSKSEEASKIRNLNIGYEIINGQFFITSLEEGIQ